MRSCTFLFPSHFRLAGDGYPGCQLGGCRLLCWIGEEDKGECLGQR